MSKKHKNIEVMARGIFVCQGRLLVCHTRGADNTYLPGGHVEFKESAQDSLIREVAEELNLKARVKGFAGVVEHAYHQKGRLHCEINLVFRMELPIRNIRQPPISAEGHLDFRWIPLRTLSRSDLEPAPLRRLITIWLRSPAAHQRWAALPL